MPGCETLPLLPPRQNLFSHLLLLSPTRDGVAGWEDQLLLRASTEHILIVRGLRARKLAARLALLLPARHVVSLFNQTPHHRISIGRIRLQRSVGTAD